MWDYSGLCLRAQKEGSGVPASTVGGVLGSWVGRFNTR